MNKDFLAAVEQIAKRSRAGRGARPSPRSLEALQRARDEDPMRGVRAALSAPRCTATAKATGRRCRSPAIRGTDRCRQHGGLRRNAGHPANLRRYWRGDLHLIVETQRMRRVWRGAWAVLSDEERRVVLDVLDPGAFSRRRGEAALALRARDGGRTWREFIARYGTPRRKG